MAGLRSVSKFGSIFGWDLTEAKWFPQTRERRFDSEWSVETAGFVSQEDLDMSPLRRSQAVRYEPTSSPEFHHVMAQLSLDHERFDFVDFGSGKGRVLLMACEYPFKRVIGVELSRKLHEIAIQNLDRYQSKTRRCRVYDCYCEDATSFELTNDPAVLYFYNPFNAEVLSEIATKIERSLQEHPRDLIVIYNNPVHRNVFDDAEFLTQAISEHDGRWLIYHARSIPIEIAPPLVAMQ